jgi:hypothetical protein
LICSTKLFGKSPLHNACSSVVGVEIKVLIEVLIGARANVNLHCERLLSTLQKKVDSRCTVTPFHAALSQRTSSIGVIKLLLGAGANVNLKHIHSGQVPVQILLNLKPGEGKRHHLGILKGGLSKNHIPVLKLLIE